MKKNENRDELRKPLMAVDFTDINGQERKIFFTINGRRKVLKCIEREIRKFGIIPETIHKYLISGGGKIDWKGDKDFEYLYLKKKMGGKVRRRLDRLPKRSAPCTCMG
jgi:hypothetical protein